MTAIQLCPLKHVILVEAVVLVVPTVVALEQHELVAGVDVTVLVAVVVVDDVAIIVVDTVVDNYNLVHKFVSVVELVAVVDAVASLRDVRPNVLVRVLVLAFVVLVDARTHDTPCDVLPHAVVDNLWVLTQASVVASAERTKR